ncbi:hypothetical protein ABW20_dc0104724 [Dactylellina cionopaga]|nr:hypothetical protein ABW20_dc0104724 [Dactylellina cionopaga]
MAGTCFAFLSLLLTAGAAVMVFCVLLAGTRDDWPSLNHIYFLYADTSKIPGAPKISEWTLWNVCSSSAAKGAGLLSKCGEVNVANPFLPQMNFNTTKNIPEDFIKNPGTYYYLSRFSFAFYLISLFFMLCSMLTGILALCSRLGSALSAFVSSWALFCTLFTAIMMTAAFSLGKDTFNSSGQEAGLGVYGFGLTWGAVGCMLLACVFYCCGYSSARRQRYHERGLEAEKRGGRRFPFSRHNPPAEERAQTYA